MVFNEDDVEVAKRFELYKSMYGEPVIDSIEECRKQFINDNKTELFDLSAQEIESYFIKDYNEKIQAKKEHLEFFLKNFESCFEQLKDTRIKQILIKRYGLFANDPQTQKSISQEFDVGPQRISQLQMDGQRKLRRIFYLAKLESQKPEETLQPQ